MNAAQSSSSLYGQIAAKIKNTTKEKQQWCWTQKLLEGAKAYKTTFTAECESHLVSVFNMLYN